MKLVIQNTARVWGGNEKMLATLAKGLSERGHSVIISCARGLVSERLEAMGLRTRQFRPRGSLDPASGLSFAWWLRRQRPDALLITSWRSISWGSFAGRVAGVRRTVLRQGIVRAAPRRGMKRYATRHWIDDVITNAPEIRERWIETAPEFQSERVHVVLNAVTPIAHRRGELRERLRQELGLSDEMILIGTAGILTRRKGFDLVLKAIASRLDPRIHLAIIGDGPHRRELEALSRELRLTAGTHFLGKRAVAAEAIAGLDVFVLSSHNEGMANVMLEAMAAGVPVIASEISGVQTAIGAAEGRSAAGWTFSPGSAESLAAMIGEMAELIRSQSAMLDARTTEALDRITTRFSLDRMLDENEKILFG